MTNNSIINTSTFVYWNELMEKSPPEAFRQMFEHEKRYLKRVVSQGSFVLDLGCGNGRSLSYLVGSGRNLVGIDNDILAIGAAEKRFESVEDVRVFHSDIFNYDSKERADYVLCMGNTLGNFGSKKNSLIEIMGRLAKPSGELIVGVYNEDAFEERMKHYGDLGGAVSRIEGTTVYVAHGAGELVSEQFSRDQLIKMFSERGFDPIEIEKSGIAYIGRFRRK